MKGFHSIHLLFVCLLLASFILGSMVPKAQAVVSKWTVNGKEYSSQDTGPVEYLPGTGFRFSYFIDSSNLVFGWDDATTDEAPNTTKAATQYRIDYVYESSTVTSSAINVEFCKTSTLWKSFDGPFNVTYSERSGSVVNTYRKPIHIMTNGGNRIAENTFFRLVAIIDGKPEPVSCGLQSLKPVHRTTDGRPRLIFEATDVDTNQALTGVQVSIKQTATSQPEVIATVNSNPVYIVDPAKFANLSTSFNVTFSKTGYKSWDVSVPFDKGGIYKAQLVKTSSSKASTGVAQPDNESDRGGAPEPANAAGTDPGSADNKYQECGKFLGGLGGEGLLPQPGKYLACQSYNLVIAAGGFIERMVKRVPF